MPGRDKWLRQAPVSPTIANPLPRTSSITPSTVFPWTWTLLPSSPRIWTVGHSPNFPIIVSLHFLYASVSSNNLLLRGSGGHIFVTKYLVLKSPPSSTTRPPQARMDEGAQRIAWEKAMHDISRNRPPPYILRSVFSLRMDGIYPM